MLHVHLYRLLLAGAALEGSLRVRGDTAEVKVFAGLQKWESELLSFFPLVLSWGLDKSYSLDKTIRDLRSKGHGLSLSVLLCEGLTLF